MCRETWCRAWFAEPDAGWMALGILLLRADGLIEADCWIASWGSKGSTRCARFPSGDGRVLIFGCMSFRILQSMIRIASLLRRSGFLRLVLQDGFNAVTGWCIFVPFASEPPHPSRADPMTVTLHGSPNLGRGSLSGAYFARGKRKK